MKESLLFFLLFAVGMAVGFIPELPKWLLHENWTTGLLFILMFLGGVSIGQDKSAIAALKSMKPKVLLIPVAVITGSVLGGYIVGYMFETIRTNEAMSVASGLGYYSLSAVIIKDIHSDILGATALLSNVFREVITLLFAPLLARYINPVAPIASGGATCMDTTLPVVIRVSGQTYAIPSLISGVICTLFVPILVSLFLEMAP